MFSTQLRSSSSGDVSASSQIFMVVMSALFGLSSCDGGLRIRMDDLTAVVDLNYWVRASVELDLSSQSHYRKPVAFKTAVQVENGKNKCFINSWKFCNELTKNPDAFTCYCSSRKVREQRVSYRFYFFIGKVKKSYDNKMFVVSIGNKDDLDPYIKTEATMQVVMFKRSPQTSENGLLKICKDTEKLLDWSFEPTPDSSLERRFQISAIEWLMIKETKSPDPKQEEQKSTIKALAKLQYDKHRREVIDVEPEFKKNVDVSKSNKFYKMTLKKKPLADTKITIKILVSFNRTKYNDVIETSKAQWVRPKGHSSDDASDSSGRNRRKKWALTNETTMLDISHGFSRIPRFAQEQPRADSKDKIVSNEGNNPAVDVLMKAIDKAENVTDEDKHGQLMSGKLDADTETTDKITTAVSTTPKPPSTRTSPKPSTLRTTTTSTTTTTTTATTIVPELEYGEEEDTFGDLTDTVDILPLTPPDKSLEPRIEITQTLTGSYLVLCSLQSKGPLGKPPVNLTIWAKNEKGEITKMNTQQEALNLRYSPLYTKDIEYSCGLEGDAMECVKEGEKPKMKPATNASSVEDNNSGDDIIDIFLIVYGFETFIVLSILLWAVSNFIQHVRLILWRQKMMMKERVKIIGNIK